MKLSKENIQSLLKKDKLLIIFLIGILLLIFMLPSSNQDKQGSAQQPDEGGVIQQTDSQEQYKKQMEDELETLLGYVDGVGKVEVMITLAGTPESVVCEDMQKNSSKITEQDSTGGTRETVEEGEQASAVMSQENGDSAPFVIKENMPEIQGVIVVAEGGGNDEVVKNISEAIKALFGIEVHKIKVMKMNS